MDYLEGLNEPQAEAVSHADGPLMVLAGAGSGKTRVLTYRIVHLLKTNKANPWEILALTFTNKAAAEMKERIAHLIGNTAHQIWCGTFHAIFAQILRENADILGFNKSFSILDTTDTQASMKLVLKNMKVEFEKNDHKKLVGIVSRLKNNKISSNNFDARKHLHPEEQYDYPYFTDLYREYTQFLKKSNAMDFDDLLINTYRLFTNFPDVLAFYQQKFRYILVDEYQDTNEIQYLITALLAQQHQNICVVGDDAQSIYSFRGADIQNILNFPNQYPGAKVVKLEQNYRSTSRIVDTANSLIKNNANQHFKNVWSDLGEGHKVQIHGFDNDLFEADFVAKTIQNLRNVHDVPLSEIAILYRTNVQSRKIEDQLRKRNLLYRIFGGLSFYQRAEIKDLIAYMKLALNKNNLEAFNRIVNVPARGIGPSSLDKINEYIHENDVPLSDALHYLTSQETSPLTTKVKNSLKNLVEIIHELNFSAEHMSPSDFMNVLLDQTKYTEKFDDKKAEEYSKIQNIEEFTRAIEEIELNSDETVTLDNLLEKISLATDVMEDEKDETKDLPKISMMTMHMAKGLEFPCVFIVGVEKDMLPSSRNETDAGKEEERRLFYVGITRAQRVLYLSYARQRQNWGNNKITGKSEFLDELNGDLVQEFQDYRKVDSAISSTNSHFMNRKGQFANRQSTKNKQSLGQRTEQEVTELTEWGEYQLGDRIEHKVFGEGVIKRITITNDNPIAETLFDRHKDGVKKILLNFVKISKI